MRMAILIGRIGLFGPIGLITVGWHAWSEARSPRAARDNGIYEFKLKSIDGQEVPFEKLKGKVLMAVNVASR